jgi:catecholate siderophore receptor
VEFDTFDVEHKVFVGGEYTHTSSDQNRFNAVFSPGSGPSNRNGTFGGADFRLADGSGLNQAAALVTSGFTHLNDDTRVTIDTASVYFQDEIALTDQLDFVIGGRYDTFDIFVVDAAPGGVNRSRMDEEFSPRYGMVFKPIEDISVYGAYSESFLPRSGEQFSDLGGGRDALDPNTYTNMEAGVNWAVSDGLSLRTAIFENAESSPTVAGPGALVVVDSETTGYEFELTGTVTENWFLSTGYTYLNGEIVNVGGPTGQRPRELPKNSFSVWNKFQLTDRFGLGLGLVYQDDSFAEVNNLVTLPAYTRVDAAAYYQLSEKTRLQVNIENLFDTEYFPHAHTNHNISVGSPINATFSVKSSF